MAIEILYDKDVNPEIIQGKKIAIIGYGSQGHAHALNLHDSGCDVRVGLRPESKSAEEAREHGLKVVDIDTAAEEADVVMILIPDEIQAKTYEEHIAPHLHPGDTLAFAHGFNIHYGYIKAPEGVNVIMVAPKGPGHIVRRQYTEGSGVPDLCCVYEDATGDAWDIALSYGWAIGGGRAGLRRADGLPAGRYRRVRAAPHHALLVRRDTGAVPGGAGRAGRRGLRLLRGLPAAASALLRAFPAQRAGQCRPPGPSAAAAHQPAVLRQNEAPPALRGAGVPGAVRRLLRAGLCGMRPVRRQLPVLAHVGLVQVPRVTKRSGKSL